MSARGALARATQLVRFDPCPDDPHRATATPIYQTATFAQESAEEFGRYDYTRSGNPTREVLEAQLARLELGTRAFAFASGMAALSTLTRLVPAGRTILAGDDLYGGTFRLLERVLPRAGVVARYVDATDAGAVERALTPDVALLLVESPTNPRLRVCDLAALAGKARARGVLFAVDNTLLSPWLQNPLELGADVVVHSATKLLAGHGDATAGVLVVRDEALAQEIAFLRNAEGNALAPLESWLVLRGMKTLGLRVERAQENAARVAQLLVRSPFVKRVHYPGLAADPGRAVLARQARGAGQVLSFEAGSYEDARAFVEALELFSIAVSFGCVSSQASLPGRMSHASIPPAQRARNPLPEGLVRLSIGIEDGRDLCADVESAFARVRGAPHRHERAVPERS